MSAGNAADELNGNPEPTGDTDGGRVVVPHADGSGAKVINSCPPACRSRAGSQVWSSGSPLKTADWTYCTSPSGVGSTKPSVSMVSSPPLRLSRDWAKDGALIR
jgi:hypothetical protein